MISSTKAVELVRNGIVLAENRFAGRVLWHRVRPLPGSGHVSDIAWPMLWKVLTAKRWELLKALGGAGPLSIREAARRVERDVKGVHGDVVALIGAGLIRRTDSGRIEFPYEAIKVEFVLRAA